MALRTATAVRALLTFALVLHFILGEAVFSLPSPANLFCIDIFYNDIFPALTWTLF